MSNELGASAFKEKPDISMVFIRQLDRTNLAASLTYQDAINQILANLPTEWRRWVYDQEDTYKTVEATLMYKRFGGRRLGSRNAPLLRDPKIPLMQHKDGSIDWSDPNIVSPILEEISKTDYQKFNELVMDAAQLAGLTWQTESRERIVVDILNLKRSKSPYRIPREEDEEDPNGDTDAEEG